MELSWSMHVNPDSILSLDTEAGLPNLGSSTGKPLFPKAEHGVRMVRCSPGQPEPRLAAEYDRHVQFATNTSCCNLRELKQPRCFRADGSLSCCQLFPSQTGSHHSQGETSTRSLVDALQYCSRCFTALVAHTINLLGPIY